ncbi:MAG TPA: 50S ribosomal protein L35 [Myxococcota bacterium]|nr:50S ribosomal protein L35 [Myxococcota bacterium]
MPKMKTRRGAAKRFSVNKNGKVRFKRANKRHNLESQSKKTKRQSRANGVLNEQDAKHVRAMLPYG